MRKPTCSLCQGKVVDNTYIYLPKEKKLVHILCNNIQKDMIKNITVHVQPIQMGVEGKL